MMNTLRKLILNLIKTIYKTTAANIILNSVKFEAFPLTSGTRKGVPLLSLLPNIILKVLANAIRQEKEVKGMQIEIWVWWQTPGMPEFGR
jgi:hypothetical protein